MKIIRRVYSPPSLGYKIKARTLSFLNDMGYSNGRGRMSGPTTKSSADSELGLLVEESMGSRTLKAHTVLERCTAKDEWECRVAKLIAIICVNKPFWAKDIGLREDRFIGCWKLQYPLWGWTYPRRRHRRLHCGESLAERLEIVLAPAENGAERA